MSDVLQMVGSPNAELIRVFGRLAELSNRSLEADMLKQSKELAEALFIEAPRASAPEIMGKLRSLGWAFKRPPSSYSNHAAQRAFRPNTMQTILARKARKALYDSFKIRRTKGKSGIRAQSEFFEANPDLARAYYEASRQTMEEAQYAAFRYRSGHIGYIGSTFIPAMRQLGSTMRVASGKAAITLRPMSHVEITGADAMLQVIIVNRAPGVAKVADATGFVNVAIAFRIADMETYIARKELELVQHFLND